MEWTGNDVFEIDAKLAEGPHGVGKRMNSFRRNPIVIGDQNQWHESPILSH